jgi:hypothetical protein
MSIFLNDRHGVGRWISYYTKVYSSGLYDMNLWQWGQSSLLFLVNLSSSVPLLEISIEEPKILLHCLHLSKKCLAVVVNPVQFHKVKTTITMLLSNEYRTFKPRIRFRFSRDQLRFVVFKEQFSIYVFKQTESDLYAVRRMIFNIMPSRKKQCSW